MDSQFSGKSEPPLARPIGFNHAVQTLEFPRTSISPSHAKIDLAIILLVIVGVMAVSLLVDLQAYAAKTSFPGLRYLPVLGNGLASLFTVAILLRLRQQTWAAIGLNRASPGRVLLSALIAVPACYAAGAVSNVVVTLARGADFLAFARERTEFFEAISDIPLGWVFPIAIFVGIYEEIVFRGLVLTRLRALFSTNRGPVLLSSLIFGALHFTQGPTGMCQTFVVGLILSILAIRTRSIWPAILAHTLIDTLSLLITVLYSEDVQHFLHEVSTRPVS